MAPLVVYSMFGRTAKGGNVCAEEQTRGRTKQDFFRACLKQGREGGVTFLHAFALCLSFQRIYMVAWVAKKALKGKNKMAEVPTQQLSFKGAFYNIIFGDFLRVQISFLKVFSR